MTLILGIETSTKICSVAISDGQKLLALKEEGGEYSHAEKLNGFIEEVVQQAGITLKDIDVLAVSKGPGSYTGLRIGVSTAKGLCYALDKPLIAVDTLQAMALKMVAEDSTADLFVPMLDARRMEVYVSIYDTSNQSTEAIEAKIIDSNSFAEELKNHDMLFVGDGAAKCKTDLANNQNAYFSDGGLPSAEYINRLAYKKFLENDFENVAYFEPYYLKDFIATTAKKLL